MTHDIPHDIPRNTPDPTPSITPEASTTAARAWEARYQSQPDHIWSGEPNATLVREATRLVPGTALDLGCGEGGDAIWLAKQGWRVTAVDISQTALDRGAANAARAGVSDLIDWQRFDLARSFPQGSFGLVSAQYLHSHVDPIDFPRERILRNAAAAVLPGGTLLIVGHAGVPPWAHDGQPAPRLPSPHEVLDSLELLPNGWHVETLDSPTRTATGPGGHTAEITDSVLTLTRLAV